MWRLVACCAAGVSLAVVLTWARPAPAAPPRKPPTVRMGVVDVRGVYNKWSKVKDFTTGLEAEKKREMEALAKIEATMNEKRAEADALAPGPRRDALETQIAGLTASYDHRLKRWNDTVKKKLDEGVVALYNEIVAKVGSYARGHELTLVLKIDSRELGGDSDDNANVQINRRAVLFSADEYDITEEVLEELEAK